MCWHVCETRCLTPTTCLPHTFFPPAEERQRRMDFEIVQGGELPKSMEVRMSPTAMVEKLQQDEDPLLP